MAIGTQRGTIPATAAGLLAAVLFSVFAGGNSRVAVVSVGSTVDFPNFDKVFHNVFSLSTAMVRWICVYQRNPRYALGAMLRCVFVSPPLRLCVSASLRCFVMGAMV